LIEPIRQPCTHRSHKDALLTATTSTQKYSWMRNWFYPSAAAAVSFWQSIERHRTRHANHIVCSPVIIAVDLTYWPPLGAGGRMHYTVSCRDAPCYSGDEFVVDRTRRASKVFIDKLFRYTSVGRWNRSILSRTYTSMTSHARYDFVWEL